MNPEFNKSYFEGPNGFVETLHVKSFFEGQFLEYQGVKIIKSLHGRVPKSNAKAFSLNKRDFVDINSKYKVSLPAGNYFVHGLEKIKLNEKTA